MLCWLPGWQRKPRTRSVDVERGYILMVGGWGPGGKAWAGVEGATGFVCTRERAMHDAAFMITSCHSQQGGSTALISACQCGHLYYLEVVQALLAARADKEAEDRVRGEAII